MSKVLFVIFVILCGLRMYAVEAQLDLYQYEIGVQKGKGLFLTVYADPQVAPHVQYTCFRQKNSIFFDLFYDFVKEIKASKNNWLVTSYNTHTYVNYYLGTETLFIPEYGLNPNGEYITPAHIQTSKLSTRNWQNTVIVMSLSVNDAGEVIGFRNGAIYTRTMTENFPEDSHKSSTTTEYFFEQILGLQSSCVSRTEELPPGPPGGSYSCSSSSPFTMKMTDTNGISCTIDINSITMELKDRHGYDAFNLFQNELNELSSLQYDTLRYAGGNSSSYNGMNASYMSMYTYTNWIFYPSPDPVGPGVWEPIEYKKVLYSTTSFSGGSTSLNYPNPGEPPAPIFYMQSNNNVISIIRFADDIYRTLAENQF